MERHLEIDRRHLEIDPIAGLKSEHLVQAHPEGRPKFLDEAFQIGSANICRTSALAWIASQTRQILPPRAKSREARLVGKIPRVLHQCQHAAQARVLGLTIWRPDRTPSGLRRSSALYAAGRLCNQFGSNAGLVNLGKEPSPSSAADAFQSALASPPPLIRSPLFRKA
jgi:hypothetical protein